VVNFVIVSHDQKFQLMHLAISRPFEWHWPCGHVSAVC